MSKPYVPGPSFIYVSTGGNNAWEHLGFTDDTVEVSTSVEHAKVSADFAGGMASDYQMIGEEIVVAFRLSWFNESVLTLCRQRLKTALSDAPGSGLSGAIGSLIGAEGNYFGLAILSAYGPAGSASKAVFNDMLPGIVIPRAFLAGDTSVKLGTQVKMPAVVFRGLPSYTDGSGGGYDGRYTLFSSDLSSYSFPNPT